jgi:hypothetical protein
MLKKFEIYGLSKPARIYQPGFGEIVLDNITDEKAEAIYKAGCPFIKPVPEYRAKLNPAEKPIKPEPLPVIEYPGPGFVGDDEPKRMRRFERPR